MQVSPERWQQVKKVLAAALEREEDQRGAYLNQACAGDNALRQEVESLLAEEKGAEGFLEVPALEIPSRMFDQDPSKSLCGRQLGSYKVLSLLGAGGMGEVYEAHDTKLGRKVALKILPSAFVHDPERLSRFQREARTLAALNHPNIATIHGLEESGGVYYLVMELVPGETLAERVRAGPLAVGETLRICGHVAEALEAAHEKGVIHRDLKPANVKVTPEGRVKVLDFGLAKAFTGDGGEDLSHAPTLTAVGTEDGRILGTPAYMSPEQACGKAVDKRTDIWSFGCVLYESLTARQAFRGATITEVLAAILEREPDWQALPSATPPTVQALLRKCLRKDPHDRLRDIGDARIELEDAMAGTSKHDVSRPKPFAITRRAAISALAGAAAGAAGVGVFGISHWRSATPRNLTQFATTLPEGEFCSASFNRRVAISPEGTHLAYNVVKGTANVFYVRSLRELVPKLIPSRGGAAFFSPDGQWIGFFGGWGFGGEGPNQVRKIGLGGGAPMALGTGDSPAGGTWAADDTIYYVAGIPGGIMRVPAGGGQPKEAASIDFANGERLHKYPCALPGGKAVLFTVATADAESFDDARIAVFSAETGKKKILVEGGTHPRYSPSGHLLYARGGNLLAVPFDPKRLETMGQPFTVLEGVLMSRNTGVANFDVSASGDLVYIPGIADGGERRLVWVDRNGKAEPLPLSPRSYLHPRISPDGRQLAVEIEGPNHDFYVYDFARGVLTRMTMDGESHWPVWSADGTQLVYRSGPMMAWRLWRVPTDRSRAPEQLPAMGLSQNPEDSSPDGHALAYTAFSLETNSDVMVLPLNGDRQPRPIVATKFVEGSPKFSPDGRWLAYCSNESGKPQVYVQAYPGPGPKIQVSTEGGSDPVWKRTGGELYYRNGDSMMAVAMSTASTFSAGRPHVLWQGHYSHGMSSSCGPPGATSSNYDITPDGRRFLMIKDNHQDSAISKQIVVVLGWADELSRSSTKT
jgi:serine/threonine protein kinase/Tol biopolymer transport system component